LLAPCAGCPAEMKKNGAAVVHLATGLEVVMGTHPIKHVLTDEETRRAHD